MSRFLKNKNKKKTSILPLGDCDFFSIFILFLTYEFMFFECLMS